jgi:hypothetical protein
MLRLDGGSGTPLVHASPVRRQRSPTVALRRPALDATGLVRDADGGTGRVRVSIIYATRCAGADRQRVAYFPPAQIANVRVAPGVRIPIQRTRRATLTFDPACEVVGKVFAEATNARAWRASATRSGSGTPRHHRPTEQRVACQARHQP